MLIVINSTSRGLARGRPSDVLIKTFRGLSFDGGAYVWSGRVLIVGVNWRYNLESFKLRVVTIVTYN